MPFQDSTFLLLLLTLASFPIAAKALAEIYILIATRLGSQKGKHRKRTMLLKR